MFDEETATDEDAPNAGLAIGPDPDVSVARADWEAAGGPSVAVVEAVAAATDRNPLDVALLNEYVDPDALDALLASPEDGSRRTVRTWFTYDGCEVVVGRDGRLDVYVRRDGRE
ncbi:HalOD1 output domain-containing protein [Halorarum salinum]|uniref:Halobacterial output domain-containing protein n=1 Tax=Halorarum salinum TaxID=2743089 RepID=A0A7D5QG04_9EURY|nr:HalOD1 output domain-containing protein [Halobaculum salinum]QLG61843.1 hypothetical protein HUG12_08935 [Halobaculum salinum]